MKKQELILFSVHDEGPGMEKENIQRIFDGYSRQKSMIEQERSQDGLGLAIVYKYTTAMNGKVTCESLKGKGTRFVVELPA